MRSAIVELIIRGKNQTAQAFRDVRGEAQGTLDRVRTSLSGIQGLIASLGLAIGSGALVKYVADANVQFQQLTARLQTFTGSAASARAVYQQLADFAASTPFELQQAVEAFINLRSAGLQPTLATLTALGNVASAFGGTITDVAEAVRAGATGEMERLKRFGITATLEGDKIVASFEGQRTTIDRSAVALTNYLEKLSNAHFAGAMAREMDTLGGQLSNVKDNFFQLAVQVGEAGAAGAFKDLLKELNDFLQGLRESPGTLNYVVRLLVQTVVTATKTVVDVTAIFFRAGNSMVLWAKQTFLGLQLLIAQVLNLTFQGANKAIAFLNTLPGVDIKVRAPDVTGFLDQAIDEWNQGKDNIQNVADSAEQDLRDLGTAWLNLGKAALGSADDQERAAKKIGGLKDKGLATATNRQVSYGGFTDHTGASNRVGSQAVGQEQQLVDAANAGGAGLAMAGGPIETATDFGREKKRGIEAVFEAMTSGAREADKAMKELGDSVDYLGGYLAVSFAGNWSDAWEAFGSGAVSASQAVIQAGRKAVADYASAKAKSTALDAGEALAKGLTNPVELLKAAKLFAISAAWSSLAGLLGGRGGGGRGGGGAGGERAGRDSRALAASSEEVGTIVIEGGLLNMNDPRQAEAFEKAVNRLGRQKRIRVVGG